MFEKAAGLFRYLNTANCTYAVIGGFALTYYGVNRGTADIDLLLGVATSDVDALVRKLWAKGLITRSEHPYPSLGIVYINTLRVDLIPYLTPQEKAALYNAKYKNLFGTKVRVARLEICS